MDELKITCKHIMSSVYCEDIFGLDSNMTVDNVHKIYRRLTRTVHPDRYTNIDSKNIATEAFKMLNEFYEDAKKKINDCTYGHRTSPNNNNNVFIIKTRKHEYKIRSILAEGDLSTVYIGDDEVSKNIVTKVIYDTDDNDFMRNEIRILKLFNSASVAQNKHLPVLLDTFKTSEDNLGLILEFIEGYDLYSIRDKYKNGINERHMVWILKRLLSVLGYAHSKGVIHGNIDPSHIIVRPRDHNVFLVDWSYAVINPKHTGDRFKIINDDFSAPEISRHTFPIPSSDLYSVGKCMIYLLGGDIKNNNTPSCVNSQIKHFLKGFMLESPFQRVQDSWRTYDELVNLNNKIWERKFLEFEM